MSPRPPAQQGPRLLPPPLAEAQALYGFYFDNVSKMDVEQRVQAFAQLFEHQVERAFASPYLLFLILQQLGRLEALGTSLHRELQATRSATSQGAQAAHVSARGTNALAEQFQDLLGMLEDWGGALEPESEPGELGPEPGAGPPPGHPSGDALEPEETGDAPVVDGEAVAFVDESGQPLGDIYGGGPGR